jgi:galactokinase
MFGDKRPRIFRAPGRVNLIGEHTDYNEGFVMPAAIGFEARVAVAPAADRAIQVHSRNYAETVCFSLEKDIADDRRRNHWSDYVRGVCVMLERSGHRLSGANLVIDSTVPIGAGLSSSAALEVATAMAMIGISDVRVDRTEIALLCQRAENEIVGTRSGIMDQFISCYGRAGHALLLDCRSLEKTYEPLPGRVQLVICNTMVRHELASGEYSLRRSQCETGVLELKKELPDIKSLRDVSEGQLYLHGQHLDPLIYRRCRHVITENARVLAAARALRNADFAGFGRLMVESHRSLRDDFEVSAKELDLMVDLALGIARESPGVFGARMTGGGFGGCTINLVESGIAHDFARTISRQYESNTGTPCSVYICAPADGASETRV